MTTQSFSTLLLLSLVFPFHMAFASNEVCPSSPTHNTAVQNHFPFKTLTSILSTPSETTTCESFSGCSSRAPSPATRSCELNNALLAAMHEEEEITALYWLMHGADINMMVEKNQHILINAIDHNMRDLAQYLITNGANLNIYNYSNQHLLEITITNNWVDESLLIIERTDSTSLLQSALITAIEEEHEQIALAILQKHSPLITQSLKTNTASLSLLTEAFKTDPHSPLMLAIEKNLEPVALELLKKDNSPSLYQLESKTLDNQPLLCAAISKNMAGLAKILIEKGANPDIQDFDGTPALCMALCENYEDVIDTMLQANVNINVVFQKTGPAFLMAGLLKNPRLINKIKPHLEKNIKNCKHSKALLQLATEQATKSLWEHCVTYLQELCMNSNLLYTENHEDTKTDTFLHNHVDGQFLNALRACTDAYNTYETIAIAFLAVGANPNLQLSTSLSVLYRSVELGMSKLSNNLMRCGADIHFRTPKGSTLLDIANQSQQYDLCRDLYKRGVVGTNNSSYNQSSIPRRYSKSLSA